MPDRSLGSLTPKFRKCVNAFIRSLEAAGIPVADSTRDKRLQKAEFGVLITETFRSVERQNELYDQGGVTRVRGGGSYHNYGCAVDVAITHGDPETGECVIDWTPRPVYVFAVHEQATKHGLSWIFGWDELHFRPAGKLLAECRAEYEKWQARKASKTEMAKRFKTARVTAKKASVRLREARTVPEGGSKLKLRRQNVEKRKGEKG